MQPSRRGFPTPAFGITPCYMPWLRWAGRCTLGTEGHLLLMWGEGFWWSETLRKENMSNGEHENAFVSTHQESCTLKNLWKGIPKSEDFCSMTHEGVWEYEFHTVVWRSRTYDSPYRYLLCDSDVLLIIVSFTTAKYYLGLLLQENWSHVFVTAVKAKTNSSFSTSFKMSHCNNGNNRRCFWFGVFFFNYSFVMFSSFCLTGLGRHIKRNFNNIFFLSFRIRKNCFHSFCGRKSNSV